MNYLVSYLSRGEWKQLCTDIPFDVRLLLEDDEVEILQIRKMKENVNL